MANKRTHWVDHVVERPNTYKEVTNTDGTVTHQDASGAVIQQGTPISATNLNKLEEVLQHYAVAFDMLLTINYALSRAQQKQIEDLEDATAELTT